MRRVLLLLVLLSLVALFIVGCRRSPATDAISGAEGLGTLEPPVPTETPAPEPTLTPLPTPTTDWTLYIDPSLQEGIRQAVAQAAGGLGIRTVEATEEALLRAGHGLGHELAQWVYAAVVPFPVLADAVQWQDIQSYWAGEEALQELTGSDAVPTLLVGEQTRAALAALLGPPADGARIAVAPDDELLERAWEERPNVWAIVPFDHLAPRWKVLAIDGMNPLDKALDLDAYPLVARIGVDGERAEEIAARIAGAGLLTNRDTEQMTTLIMTGVTAMVRAMAHEMEVRGVLFPAQDIGPTLQAADILHISNEIPFASNCPPPDRNSKSLVFCSDPKYIELLRHIDTSLIELTGNHFQDYGDRATLETLEMYREEGWPYYGGGENLEDARKPIQMEHAGNTFSFIGCNPVGPTYAWATEDRPGAADCDWDYMHGELNALRKVVDVPIATFQYWEFYHYEPTPQQRADFRSMADAGALIVSGSQAHHPQAIEFYGDAFIHYGLGNIFFDQMWSLGTRQIMVDRHIIYQGRHLSTELLTYMLEDYARPRPMDEAERRQLLTAVFAASGW